MVAKIFRPSMNELSPYIHEAISAGKAVRLTVTGNSMYPLFRDGRDNVTLRAIKTLKKGDVVFYRRKNGDHVLHRILRIDGDALTMAGDNETVKEYPVMRSDCIAVMESFVRMNLESCVTDTWYRMYSKFWVFVFPFRRSAVRLLHFCSQVYKKLFVKSGQQS